MNFASVGFSAVNPMGKFKLAKTLIVEGVKEAVEWKPNSQFKVKTDVKNIATKAVLNSAINIGSTKISKKIVNISSNVAVKGAKANVIAKSKNLTKANNSVKNSNLKSKSKLPMEAFKKFDDAKMHL
ncbi:hypothetical protein E0494_10835 [Marinilabiliaceae bacterium JC040]|nr:hypothetical protein [Marinilabiliaceae bacterium JC040]